MTAQMRSTDWDHRYSRCLGELNGSDSAVAGSPTVPAAWLTQTRAEPGVEALDRRCLRKRT